MGTLETIRAKAGDYPMMVAMIGILALMIVPLPTFVLDALLAVNVTAGVVILLTALYVMRPLDFSVFPALLLVTTLFRLGLNVASTRLILLGAAEGKAEAGNIIETFGRFVVGGNIAVGIVVFLILVIINFMVITKGSGRIAEVAARFTLDALPGKQMSIDGELANGALTEEEARRKRDEVQREADFYGAMDGASKFVRGDAIAGLLITAINLVGGLLIGVVEGGMGAGEAAQAISVLTVGDGLVGQIPALLISTAAGIIVTRAASSQRLNDELGAQLGGNERVLYGAGGVLLLLGLIPGMPLLIFGALGAGCVWAARRVSAISQAEEEERARPEPDEGADEEPTLRAADAIQSEQLALEIGYGLIPLVDESRGGQLVHKLFAMRKSFAKEMGVVIPSIHIRDNLDLRPGAYRVLLKGSVIGGGELSASELLALEPIEPYGVVEGRATTDPTFGLPALWIAPEDRWEAESAGYTVVETDAVLATHATEIVRAHCHELVGWAELHARLDALRELEPQLVDAVVPGMYKPGDVLDLMRRLLRESVSVRDLRTILEALAERAGAGGGMPAATEHVRSRLAAQMSAAYASSDGQIYAVVLARALEDRLRSCLVVQAGEPVLACDLTTAQGLFASIEKVNPLFRARDAEVTILAPPDLRAPLFAFLSQFIPNLRVISHRDLLASVQLASLGELGPDGETAALQAA